MKTFKLHLVRHGLTQGNIDKLYMGGGLDLPLCDEGRAELRRLKNECRYPTGGVLFSSPMQRALETADILFPEMQNRLIIEDLRECRFGVFEGQLAAELMKNPDFLQWLDPKSDFVPSGGESGLDFATRCARALGEMFTYLMQNDITQGICVAHGGVIMSMLAQKGIPREPMQAWRADNGCGFTVQTDAAMLMRDDMIEIMGALPQRG